MSKFKLIGFILFILQFSLVSCEFNDDGADGRSNMGSQIPKAEGAKDLKEKTDAVEVKQEQFKANIFQLGEEITYGELTKLLDGLLVSLGNVIAKGGAIITSEKREELLNIRVKLSEASVELKSNDPNEVFPEPISYGMRKILRNSDEIDFNQLGAFFEDSSVLAFVQDGFSELIIGNRETNLTYGELLAWSTESVLGLEEYLGKNEELLPETFATELRDGIESLKSFGSNIESQGISLDAEVEPELKDGIAAIIAKNPKQVDFVMIGAYATDLIFLQNEQEKIKTVFKGAETRGDEIRSWGEDTQLAISAFLDRHDEHTPTQLKERLKESRDDFSTLLIKLNQAEQSDGRLRPEVGVGITRILELPRDGRDFDAVGVEIGNYTAALEELNSHQVKLKQEVLEKGLLLTAADLKVWSTPFSSSALSFTESYQSIAPSSFIEQLGQSSALVDMISLFASKNIPFPDLFLVELLSETLKSTDDSAYFDIFSAVVKKYFPMSLSSQLGDDENNLLDAFSADGQTFSLPGCEIEEGVFETIDIESKKIDYNIIPAYIEVDRLETEDLKTKLNFDSALFQKNACTALQAKEHKKLLKARKYKGKMMDVLKVARRVYKHIESDTEKQVVNTLLSKYIRSLSKIRKNPMFEGNDEVKQGMDLKRCAAYFIKDNSTYIKKHDCFSNK